MPFLHLFKSMNIFESFKSLKGNPKVTILCQPFWGIPFGICNFYLSLYMKSQGVTNQQLGYLISLGFVFSIIASMFGGVIVDSLGRKRTMYIDLITWPFAYLVYALSSNYFMFVLAVFANKFAGMLASVAFNCIMVEDTDRNQRMAGYNIFNIINTTTGLLVPIGGIVVKNLGLVKSERTFLFVGAALMFAMMLVRNHLYVETEMGKKMLMESRHKSVWKRMDFKSYGRTFSVMKKKPEVLMAMCLYVFFQMYLNIGSYSSLYFAPYLTETLKLDKSIISVLGAVLSAVTLTVSIFLNPILLPRVKNTWLMATGFSLDFIGLLVLIFAPQRNFSVIVLHVILYAAGASILNPHLSTLIANVTQDEERTGVFAMLNTTSSIISALVGVISGYIFSFNSVLIFVLSLGIIAVCLFLVGVNQRLAKRRNLRETL